MTAHRHDQDDPSTGRVLQAYLSGQVDALRLQESLLRAGDPEGVHQSRVAARRLRSALATYSPVLEPSAVGPLRDELRWLGGVLGEARDAEVLRLRLDALLDTEPASTADLRQQVDAARRTIDAVLRERSRTGELLAARALDGPRHRRLLGDLEALVADPAFTAEARQPARSLVPGLLSADLARLARRRRRVDRADAPERPAAWHEVRKAAKRLRYAAESAVPALGRPARRLATRAEAVQSLLGEQQDTLIAQAVLLEVAGRAQEAGEPTFTLGRLHAREEARAGALERLAPGVLDALPHRLSSHPAG